ncbi:MAG: PAS domain S-box protein [Verrucomicrobiia bacterium]
MNELPSKNFPRWLAASFAGTTLAMLAAGALFYYHQRESTRQDAKNDLESIARLKVDQIVQWRNERLADTSVLMERSAVTQRAAKYIETPGPKEGEGLLARFRPLQKYYHFQDIMLVDAAGQVPLSLSGYRGALHEQAAQVLVVAMRAHQPILTDLHVGPGDLPIHMDVIAPLFANNAGKTEPRGAVVLRCEAQNFLYPMIQSWPVASASAETLLVRRDGDSVLFLNDLRHQTNTALKLRIPLTRTEVPAVMAVMGKVGVFEGKDYRGVKVVSVLRPIPDTPWFIVAKQDTAEVFAAWRFHSVLILALIFGLILLAAGAAAVVWQRGQMAHYRALFLAEAERRQADIRHRITLMSVGDAVISTDAQGHVELMNPVAETLTGWRADEASGKPLDEVFCIVNENTRKAVENPVDRVMREGMMVDMANHTLLIARDGKERPIANAGAPIREVDGALSGVVLVFRDQTKERAAQKALFVEKQRLEQASLSGRVALWEWNIATSVVEWSGAVDTMLGHRTGEFPRTVAAWETILHPDDKARVMEALEQHLRDGTPYEIDYRVRRTVGDYASWHDSGVAERNAQGQPLRMIGACVDITGRKKAEAARRRIEESYLSLFENMLNGFAYCRMIYEQDQPQDFIYLAVNKAFETLTGLKNVVGKNVSAVIPGFLEKDRTLLEIYGRVARTGVPEKFETYLESLKMWFQISVYRPEDGDFVAVFDVITERKRAEEAICKLNAELEMRVVERTMQLEAVNKELEAFSYSVSHDLRAPLRAINGYASMLIEDQAKRLDEEGRHKLGTICGEAKRMGQLIDDLLAFSRLGRQPMNSAEIDMGAMAQRVFGECAAHAPDRKLQLKLDPSLPLARGDSAMLPRVWTNLISNAIKYTRPRSVAEIEITGRVNDGEVVYCVKDNGVGFDMQYVSHLFGVFQRLHTETEFEGTGVGLALVQRIIHRHGGRVWAEATLNEGAAFYFTLPLKKEQR